MVPSQDNQAVLIPVAFIADKAEDTIAGSSALYAVAEALRAAGTSALGPAGMAFHVTGPGGFFADFITAFGGIDGILLFVALGVVFSSSSSSTAARSCPSRCWSRPCSACPPRRW